MDNKKEYEKIEKVLETIDGDLLSELQCFFAGGTAVSLQHNYYRKSLDIDFVISNVDGYKKLREIILEDPTVIFKSPPNFLRKPMSDRYGIRMALDSGEGEPVKLEIVNIANGVNLSPDTHNKALELLMPTRTDFAWLKLLANDDRGADYSTFSRDIFDIAILDLSEDEIKESFDKALTSYSSAVRKVITKTTQLLDNENMFKDHMEKLSIGLSLFDYMKSQIEKLRLIAEQY